MSAEQHDGPTIAAVITLPAPWPTRQVVVMKHDFGDRQLFILANAGGQLVLSERHNETWQHTPFQRVRVAKPCFVILMACFAPPWLWINSHRLTPDASAALDPVTITGSGLLAPKLHFSNIDGAAIAAIRSKPEEHFVRTMIDLEQKATKPGRYELLRASGLLRQLLTDGLLNQANRRLQLKLRFRVAVAGSRLEQQIRKLHPAVSFWSGIDPSRMPEIRTEEKKLDAFLATHLVSTTNVAVSVRDVIAASANAMGGVHFGDPKPGAEQALVEFGEQLTVSGLPSSLTAVQEICNVTIVGLAPLVQRILANPR